MMNLPAILEPETVGGGLQCAYLLKQLSADGSGFLAAGGIALNCR